MSSRSQAKQINKTYITAVVVARGGKRQVSDAAVVACDV